MSFVIEAFCQCDTCSHDLKTWRCWAEGLEAPTWEFTEARQFSTWDDAHAFAIALGIQHPQWKYEIVDLSMMKKEG
jgi:hypothetical protein